MHHSGRFVARHQQPRTGGHGARNEPEYAIIVANAIKFEEVEKLYIAGADYVYMARLESAEALGEAIHEALARAKSMYSGNRV